MIKTKEQLMDSLSSPYATLYGSLSNGVWVYMVGDIRVHGNAVRYALKAGLLKAITDTWTSCKFKAVAARKNAFNYNAPYNPEFLGAKPARLGEDY